MALRWQAAATPSPRSRNATSPIGSTTYRPRAGGLEWRGWACRGWMHCALRASSPH
jgi:hypothetical protein